MSGERNLSRSVTIANHPMARITPQDLLVALVHGWCLSVVVPMTLDLVEDDPLASAGQFAGDLVRALMEVPGYYWGRHPRQYARYRAALRASAQRRRELSPEERMAFWEPLVVPPTNR